MGGPRTPDDAALAAMAPMLAQALGELTGGASPGEGYASAKTTFREFVKRDPLNANLGFVVGASALFYLAEKDVNPKVQTFFDALVYVTTCLSVGYSDIFAKSEAGKVIGSIVMTVGPSLVTKLLDPPASEEKPDLQQAILSRLEDILAELKRTNGAPAPEPGATR